ncbi:MAG: TIM barrel protein [Acidobacteriota bacterium]|nr:MAG: TIM barrel protein [Acidobacteriota bacterium]
MTDTNVGGRKGGRINHSIAYWCFESAWTLDETCKIANRLGCKSVELIDPKDWRILQNHDLVCGLTLSHWFDKGMNNPKYQPECIEQMRTAIDASAAAGFPNVLTFTGFSEDISDDQGITNCVDGYKQIIGHAEKKGVNLCLEMLNTRVDVEMKGHPGYQGDSTEYCIEIIKGVGSPNMKLLFDIYHVQIMEGDIISRIQEYQEHIGYYHVAGNPGRHEPDETQEINFGPIMQAIADTGYDGYVGLEFMPTKDPLESLTKAVEICNA